MNYFDAQGITDFALVNFLNPKNAHEFEVKKAELLKNPDMLLTFFQDTAMQYGGTPEDSALLMGQLTGLHVGGWGEGMEPLGAAEAMLAPRVLPTPPGLRREVIESMFRGNRDEQARARQLLSQRGLGDTAVQAWQRTYSATGQGAVHRGRVGMARTQARIQAGQVGAGAGYARNVARMAVIGEEMAQAISGGMNNLISMLRVTLGITNAAIHAGPESVNPTQSP